ncbi:MAG TPA: hypothetical protein VK947_05315 [Planococcus sp. (in: firmicutes)]|nr:hypothetical protein [Planococcus sp. (in: firmicutes)]
MSGIILMFIMLLFFAAVLIAAYGMIIATGRALNNHMPLKLESMQAERVLMGSIRSRN